LLFELLDSQGNIVLFVKTKREEIFVKTRQVVPLLDDYIGLKKVVPFICDDLKRPYKPVPVALASDLVIGLGINSAATESQFAGVPSFHFDLSRTEKNRFAKEGLGKVVFHSLEDMKEAITRQINPARALSTSETNNFYRALDPFRDGHASERISLYMSFLMDGFNRGLDRNAAKAHAAENYRRNWGSDKVISSLH